MNDIQTPFVSLAGHVHRSVIQTKCAAHTLTQIYTITFTSVYPFPHTFSHFVRPCPSKCHTDPIRRHHNLAALNICRFYGHHRGGGGAPPSNRPVQPGKGGGAGGGVLVFILGVFFAPFVFLARLNPRGVTHTPSPSPNPWVSVFSGWLGGGGGGGGGGHPRGHDSTRQGRVTGG